MDIVFPQYYEWHGEMEKLCQVADVELAPEVLHEIFQEIDEIIRKFMERGYSEEVPNPYQKEAGAFWEFAFSPVPATRQFGTIAYFRTLENSSDLATSKSGEFLMSMLFLKFFAERFVTAVIKAEKQKTKKPSKKKVKSTKRAKK